MLPACASAEAGRCTLAFSVPLLPTTRGHSQWVAIQVVNADRQRKACIGTPFIDPLRSVAGVPVLSKTFPPPDYSATPNESSITDVGLLRQYCYAFPMRNLSNR